MPNTHAIDAVDRQILDLLRTDARRTVRDIASRIGLTVAPVKRRIDRLEEVGIIEGYTVKLNEAKVAMGLEAVVELRVVGDMDLQTILSFASQIPEVREVLTIAGDPDALGGWCFSSRFGVGPFGAGRWSEFGFDDLQGECFEFGE